MTGLEDTLRSFHKTLRSFRKGEQVKNGPFSSRYQTIPKDDTRMLCLQYIRRDNSTVALATLWPSKLTLEVYEGNIRFAFPNTAEYILEEFDRVFLLDRRTATHPYGTATSKFTLSIADFIRVKTEDFIDTEVLL